MQYPCSLIALFAATAVLAIPVPLNINMGAYSPALVVGDGAIGFKGTESVTQLMNTLEGAAASGAAANGAANAAPATTTPAKEAAPAAAEIQQAGVVDTTPAVVATQGELPQGMGKNVVTSRAELTAEEQVEIDAEVEVEDTEKRDLTAAEQAEIDAEVAEEDADVEETKVR